MRHKTLASKQLGFTGRLCIHPAQPTIANEVFSPTPDQVAFAKAVVEAYEASVAQHGRGSTKIEWKGKSRMVDKPVLLQAQGLLRKYELAQQQDRR